MPPDKIQVIFVVIGLSGLHDNFFWMIYFFFNDTLKIHFLMKMIRLMNPNYWLKQNMKKPKNKIILLQS
jgi:hypothetical protein